MNQKSCTFVIKGELYSSKNSRLPLIYKDPSDKTIRKVIKSHCARDHEHHLPPFFAPYEVDSLTPRVEMKLLP